MVKLPDFDPIAFLMVRKFGVPGALARTPDLRSSEPQFGIDPDRAQEIANYRKELEQLPPDRLETLVKEEQERQQGEIREKAERDERQRFFNQPSARADFDHWSRAAHWSLDEAVALSFGKAPEMVSWPKLESWVGISKFAFEYHRRRDLALRAVSWKQLFDPVLPGIFLAWADRTGLAIPAELKAAVEARGVLVGDWKTLFDDLKLKFDENHKNWMEISNQKDDLIRRQSEQVKELAARLETPVPVTVVTKQEKTLGTRERESLLKLIIGMAIGGYGYDPSASRSDQPQNIADDLVKCGLPLDVDTVRKWLKHGAELLPQKQTE